MTAISKNVYIDKLDDIVNDFHFDIDFKKEVNDKDPKFKVGDHVRILKYKNIFC